MEINKDNYLKKMFIDQATPALSRHAGGGSVKEMDVNFYDYDGTLLYSYTVEEAQLLKELPPLPTQPGLICQGWNWTLDDIKAHNRAVDVGATYITDDGKTRLYIKISAEGRMDVPLYFSQTVANGVTIDWGDGSVAETLDGTGNKNTTHTYASIGEYVITLDPVDGCTLGLGHNSLGHTVFSNAQQIAAKVYCNMLQKVEIGKSVTNIGSYAFQECRSLVTISIPNSVTNIHGYAFQHCYSLTSIVIPNSVTNIGSYAFTHCYSLTSIVIPNGVTSIGDSTFQTCCSLASITIPNGVTTIGSYAFNNCYSLANIVIPNGVTSIGDYAFYYCHALASITIPNGVTTIGSHAFRCCCSLASITIPNGVTTIGSHAFNNCNSLASIVIPNSVTNIESYAFQNCPGMKFYDFSQHTSVPTLANTNAFSNIPSDCEIRVPMALVDEWKAATNWSTYADKIVGV
jgi:hypothetical protein